MIKRQFYKQEHGDNSGSSDSSSSEDSDPTPEVEVEEENKLDEEEYEEEEEEEEEQQQGSGLDKRTKCYPSPGSGYEREDSSSNPDDNDASDLISKAEEEDNEKGFDNSKDNKSIGKVYDNEDVEASAAAAITLDPNDPIQTEFSNFVLKFKSVFKCRLCPRILCLNEATVRTHLKSKRHARSKKLLGEGRLKLMLNSNGELEEEQETHAERHARILALAQKPAAPNRKDNGRQRQNRRRKKRMRSGSKVKLEASIEKTAKKKLKAAD